MKLIIAFIRPEKLDDVRRALEDIGISGMTIISVQGRGEERGIELMYRGKPVKVDFVPKIQVEVITDDEKVDRVIDAISRTAYTGRPGDGVIIVLPVERFVRVREYVTKLSRIRQ